MKKFYQDAQNSYNQARTGTSKGRGQCKTGTQNSWSQEVVKGIEIQAFEQIV